MTEESKSKQDLPEKTSPVGEALFLGEARFLMEALKTEGIQAKIIKETSNRSSKEAIHLVIVKTDHLEASEKIRQKILPEESENQEAKKPREKKNRRLIRALTMGLFGFLGGARVGTKNHGGAITGLIFAILFCILLFTCSYIFFTGDSAVASNSEPQLNEISQNILSVEDNEEEKKNKHEIYKKKRKRDFIQACILGAVGIVGGDFIGQLRGGLGWEIFFALFFGVMLFVGAYWVFPETNEKDHISTRK